MAGSLEALRARFCLVNSVSFALFNSTGTALVYSTYFGGSGDDFGQGIALDASGSAYIVGTTGSADFPTFSPLQAARAGNLDARPFRRVPGRAPPSHL